MNAATVAAALKAVEQILDGLVENDESYVHSLSWTDRLAFEELIDVCQTVGRMGQELLAKAEKTKGAEEPDNPRRMFERIAELDSGRRR